VATFHPLTVARVDQLCDDASAITLSVPDELAELYRFRPGQSLTVRRMVGDREERRSYSICAPAGFPPRIGVREVSDGAVSGWLVHEVQRGDVLDVLPPTGSFTPNMAAGGRHALIAAGSGITPMLSIAASLLRHPEAEVILLYGNRRAETVMFADEIADLKDRYPTRLQLAHVLSREAQEVDLFTGRLDAVKLRELIPITTDPARIDHWWLCGPFGMVTDAIEVLTELGVARAAIHRELFYVEDIAPPQDHHLEAVSTDGAEVTVILDGRATTTAIARDVAILDGAQRVRPDLPFACKGGVCGTCRAKLVVGEVDMRRNFALEADELAAGFILTCQSRPVSDSVTVDYDA